MIIDHTYKYIYVAIPKTGSISIQFSLKHDDIPEPDLYHQGISKILGDNQDCKNYFKFAFVRNPWARLVSLYHDFTVLRGRQYSALVVHEEPLLSEFANFEDMCLRLHESKWLENIFFRTQYDLLDMDHFCMDYIGRFENLNIEFSFVCAMLGIDAKLEERNVGKYDKTSYRKHYTDASRDAIAKIYAKDIKAFGYEF